MVEGTKILVQWSLSGNIFAAALRPPVLFYPAIFIFPSSKDLPFLMLTSVAPQFSFSFLFGRRTPLAYALGLGALVHFIPLHPCCVPTSGGTAEGQW